MSAKVSAVHVSAGPRIRIPDAAVPSSCLRTQLRRAIRALIGQRGGTMLLAAWPTGASVRIDCAIAGATANVDIATNDDATAVAIRAVEDAVSTECARCGCALVRVSCTGPAAQPLKPAA